MGSIDIASRSWRTPMVTAVEFGGLDHVLPVLKSVRDGDRVWYERDETRLTDFTRAMSGRYGVFQEQGGTALLVYNHFGGPIYRSRGYLPQVVDGREERFAVLVWPLECSGYTTWSFLVTERGLFRTKDCIAGEPSLASAYEGEPFVSRPRWQRLMSWLGTRLGPDEQ